MGKIKMGPQQLLNPRPAVLVGTHVDNKPNFLAVAWAGITSANPPTMSIAIRNIRYSLKGIRQNMTFSVNIPSVDMVKKLDYCGLVSGSKTDKVKDCDFKLFYGKLVSAPLIEQCPINIECEVLQILNVGEHSLIVGEIVETYVSDNCFTEGLPDIRKINPLSLCTLTAKSRKYYAVGEFIADAYSIGKELKAGEKT